MITSLTDQRDLHKYNTIGTTNRERKNLEADGRDK